MQKLWTEGETSSATGSVTLLKYLKFGQSVIHMYVKARFSKIDTIQKLHGTISYCRVCIILLLIIPFHFSSIYYCSSNMTTLTNALKAPTNMNCVTFTQFVELFENQVFVI